MTKEQINAAMSEIDGWREAFPKHGTPHPETRRGGILLPYVWVNERTHKRCQELPDYTTDLNAAHAAYDALPEAFRQDVINRLLEVVDYEEKYGFGTPQACWEIINASATQLTEALLKAIGQWK